MNPDHNLSFNKKIGHTGYLAIRKTLPMALDRTKLAYYLIGRLVGKRYVPNISVFVDEAIAAGVNVDNSVRFLAWTLGQVTVAFGNTWVNSGDGQAFELPGLFDVHTNLDQCEAVLKDGLAYLKERVS